MPAAHGCAERGTLKHRAGSAPGYARIAGRASPQAEPACGKWVKSPAPHTRKAFACISYSPSPSASGGFNHSLRAGSCPQATSPPGACFACIAHYAAFAFRLRRKPWVRGASAPPRGKSTSAEPSNHAARAWRSSCLSCVFWAL